MSIQQNEQQEETKRAKKQFKNLLKSQGITHSYFHKEKTGLGSSSSSNSFSSFSDSSSEEDELSNFVGEEFLESELNEPGLELKDPYKGTELLLTEEELISRRIEKVQNLQKLYKMQFRRLKDILTVNHRRFIWETELDDHVRKKNSAVDSDEKLDDELSLQKTTCLSENVRLFNYKGLRDVQKRLERKRKANDGDDSCTFKSCTEKCLPFTKFCYAHILNDPKQQLFERCKYAYASGRQCNYPVTKDTKPCLCNGHIDPLYSNNKKPSNLFSPKKPEKKPKKLGKTKKPVKTPKIDRSKSESVKKLPTHDAIQKPPDHVSPTPEPKKFLPKQEIPKKPTEAKNPETKAQIPRKIETNQTMPQSYHLSYMTPTGTLSAPQYTVTGSTLLQLAAGEQAVLNGSAGNVTTHFYPFYNGLYYAQSVRQGGGQDLPDASGGVVGIPDQRPAQ